METDYLHYIILIYYDLIHLLSYILSLIHSNSIIIINNLSFIFI